MCCFDEAKLEENWTDRERNCFSIEDAKRWEGIKGDGTGSNYVERSESAHYLAS